MTCDESSPGEGKGKLKYLPFLVYLTYLYYYDYRPDSGRSGDVKTEADTVDKWLHDRYVEEQQGPRTAEEKEKVS